MQEPHLQNAFFSRGVKLQCIVKHKKGSGVIAGSYRAVDSWQRLTMSRLEEVGQLVVVGEGGEGGDHGLDGGLVLALHT